MGETLINPNQIAGGARYQAVDYVKSVGTAYLDTRIKPDDTTIIRCKFRMNRAGGGTFIGCEEEDDEKYFRFFSLNFANTYLDLFSEDNRISSNIVASGVTYNLEWGNRYIKNLDTDTVIVSASAVTFSELNVTIKVFDLSDYGEIEYLQIIKGGNLVRDYKPVYDTKTQKYGLFDNVSELFFLSLGGTDFQGGNNE